MTNTDYFAVLGPISIGQFTDQNQLSLDLNFNMTSSAAYFSMPMVIQKSQQIDEVGVYINSVSGTSALYLISLRGVDNTGVPDTTNYGGSTGTSMLASQFVKGWNWIPLGISATGTAGDICAAHIQCITGSSTNYIAPTSYKLYNTSSPRTRTNTGTDLAHPIMAIRYADDTVQGMPLSNMSREEISLGTEYGMKFIVPVEMTCNGVIFLAHGVSNSFRMLLYDNTNVIRSTYILDEDMIALGGANETPVQIFWEPATLEANHTYRIIMQPTSVGVPIYPYEFTLVTGSYGYVFPGSDAWQLTTRTSSGTFTDTPSKRTWLGAMVSHMNPSTGTSSSTTIIAGEGAHAWAY